VAKPKAITPLGESSEFIHMAMVAASGFGKTVFCGTAPKAIILSTDPEGTLSAKRLGSKAEEWRIRAWEESENSLTEAYRYMRDEGCEEYEWLCIDNATECLELARSRCMELGRARNAKLDLYIPTQQDYQRSQNMMIQFVKKVHDLPINVIWTVHRTENEDGEGDIYYGAAIHGQKGQVAQQILGYMNIVAMGEVIEKDGKEARRYYFTHRGPHRGKDRFIALVPFKDDLDVPTMIRIIDQAEETPIKRQVRRPVKKTAATRRPRRAA
jgi:hypothetical protein